MSAPIVCLAPVHPDDVDRWRRLEFLFAFLGLWHGHRNVWRRELVSSIFRADMECRALPAFRAAMRRAGL